MVSRKYMTTPNLPTPLFAPFFSSKVTRLFVHIVVVLYDANITRMQESVQRAEGRQTCLFEVRRTTCSNQLTVVSFSHLLFVSSEASSISLEIRDDLLRAHAPSADEGANFIFLLVDLLDSDLSRV